MFSNFQDGIDALCGDLIYTPFDRDYGKSQMNQLYSTYKAFNYQPARFAPAYQVLVEQSRRLGVWPQDYANWKVLGDQAQALGKQIMESHRDAQGNIAVNVPEARPAGPGPLNIPDIPNPFKIPLWGWAVGGTLIIGGGLYVIHKVLR